MTSVKEACLSCEALTQVFEWYRQRGSICFQKVENKINASRSRAQGADPSPLPLRVEKAGGNHLNEEIIPLLPTVRDLLWKFAKILTSLRSHCLLPLSRPYNMKCVKTTPPVPRLDSRWVQGAFFAMHLCWELRNAISCTSPVSFNILAVLHQ